MIPPMGSVVFLRENMSDGFGNDEIRETYYRRTVIDHRHIYCNGVQTIDTAPRDGSTIWVCDTSYNLCKARWVDRRWYRVEPRDDPEVPLYPTSWSVKLPNLCATRERLGLIQGVPGDDVRYVRLLNAPCVDPPGSPVMLPVRNLLVRDMRNRGVFVDKDARMRFTGMIDKRVQLERHRLRKSLQRKESDGNNAVRLIEEALQTATE